MSGGLQLGPLSVVALWGSGLWGEVDGGDQACFILPYRGSGQFRQAGQSLSNLAGRTLLYLPPEPWRTSNDAMGGITIRLDPAQIRQVASTMAGPLVDPERWIDLGRHPLMLPVHQIPNGDLQFQRLYRLMAFIHGLLLSHGSLAQSLRLDDLLLRQLVQLLAPWMLAEPAEGLQRQTDTIDELVDWIHAHCHQPISLSELEQRSHYSRRSLQYAFKARFGCGPMQYLRRQRLWRAKRQLEQPGSLTSISRVAMACGYISLASFSRDFQRTFGISPSKLLRNHRDRSDPPCRTPDPRT